MKNEQDTRSFVPSTVLHCAMSKTDALYARTSDKGSNSRMRKILVPTRQRKKRGVYMVRNIIASVLFVRDLSRCLTFYRDTLGLEIQNSDAHSAAFKMENIYFLLLDPSAAASLIDSEEGELKIQVEGGPRGLLAAEVEDVDAIYEKLLAKGVTFKRPPTDQPWGKRTAHFADPEGNLWEINQSIESKSEE